MKHDSTPTPDCPELVEGPLFFLMLRAEARRKGQCFDKLSIVGLCEMRLLDLSHGFAP